MFILLIPSFSILCLIYLSFVLSLSFLLLFPSLSLSLSGGIGIDDVDSALLSEEKDKELEAWIQGKVFVFLFLLTSPPIYHSISVHCD